MKLKINSFQPNKQEVQEEEEVEREKINYTKWIVEQSSINEHLLIVECTAGISKDTKERKMWKESIRWWHGNCNIISQFVISGSKQRYFI